MIAFLFFACGAVFAASAEQPVLRAGLDRMYRMDYAAAEKTLLDGLSAQSPARAFYAGVVCLNRFLDWGDTAALRRAEDYWAELSPRGGVSARFRGGDTEVLRLHRGLAGFQLSYAASLRGHSLRAASMALAARGQLLSPTPHPAPEARAALMLYDYYRDRFLDKLPFVGSPEFPAVSFRDAASRTPAMREMLLFSLFWVHVDARRFREASEVTDDFLHRYPENRLARQLRGDLSFHAGDLAGARAEYEKLREEYASLAKPPERLALGYYKAVGNLARIRAAQGDRREVEALLAEWRNADRAGVATWLPSSLKKDVSAL